MSWKNSALPITDEEWHRETATLEPADHPTLFGAGGTVINGGYSSRLDGVSLHSHIWLLSWENGLRICDPRAFARLKAAMSPLFCWV